MMCFNSQRNITKKTKDAPNKQIFKELLVLMDFSHLHIVKYNNIFIHHSNIVIKMEFYTSSLSNIIKQISKYFMFLKLKRLFF